MKIDVYIRPNDGKIVPNKLFHRTVDSLRRNQKLASHMVKLKTLVAGGRDQHPEYDFRTLMVEGRPFVSPSSLDTSTDWTGHPVDYQIGAMAATARKREGVEFSKESIKGWTYQNGGFVGDLSRDITITLSLIVDDGMQLRRAQEFLQEQRYFLTREAVLRMLRNTATHAYRLNAQWGQASIQGDT